MNAKLFTTIALTSLLGANMAQAAEKDAKPEKEKCYGVAKAGKNDCAAKDGSNVCAGQSKKDHDTNNWVYLPKGVCEKLAGGVKG